MVKFKTFSFENILTYNEVFVDLEQVGLVSIIGENGSGKSTVWNLLDFLIYGKCAAKFSKTDLPKNPKKPSHLTLTLEKNSIEYVFCLKKTAKKWEYEISQNGVALDPHLLKDGQQRIEEVVGLSREEFFGSVFLSQRSTHVMIDGLPAERKKYISSFFGLDQRYSLLYDEANIKLKQLDEDLARIRGIQQSREIVAEQLKGLGDPVLGDLEPQLSLLYAKELIEERTKQKKVVDTYVQLYSLVENLKTACHGLDLQELISCKEQISNTLQQAGDSAKIIAHNQQVTKHNHRVDQVLAYLTLHEVLYKNENIEDLEKKYREVSFKADNENKFGRNRDRFRSLPMPETISIDPDELRSVLFDAEKRLLELKSLQKLGGGPCPTCKQDTKHLMASIEEINTLEEIIAENKSLLSVWTKNQEIERERQSLKEFDFDPMTDVEIMELHALPGKIKTLKSCLAFLEEPEENRKYMTGIEDPVFVDVKKEKENLEDILRKIQKVETFQKYSEDLQKLDYNDYLLSKQALDVFAIEESKLKSQIEIEKIKEAQRAKVLKNLEVLTKEISKAGELERQKFMFGCLSKAYGDKGIKIKQLQKVTNLVLRRLPFYATCMFADKKWTFFTEEDENTVKVLVKRPDLNDKIHDVFSFSGGQKQRLSLALMCALSDCVPQHKQTNLLVLDEVDSHLDASGQIALSSSLLPRLKQTRESVFVISHAEDVQQAALYDKSFLCKLQNGNSTLQELSN